MCGEGRRGGEHLYVFYVSWRLWEAHLYMFYVSGRLRGGTHSDDLSARVGPLERTSRVRGEGRWGGEGREGAEHVFYVSWRLWEAHLYVFYVSGRLPGGTHSDDLRARVGPLEKDLTRVGGGEGGGEGRLSIGFCSWRRSTPSGQLDS